MNQNDITNWNTIAREYDALITRGDFFREQLLNPTLLSLVGEVRNKKILDAGCGQGYLSELLTKKGATVTGIDGADTLITLARAHAQKEGMHITYTTHDLTTSLPCKDGSFEYVIANMVLMDFDPIELFIKESARVLSTNGTFIFSILHPLFATGTLQKNVSDILLRRAPHYAISQYASLFSKPWHIPGTSTHTRIYHRPISFYAEQLKQAGFVITDICEPVFTEEQVRGKNGAMKILAEIPLFLIVKAHVCPQDHV